MFNAGDQVMLTWNHGGRKLGRILTVERVTKTVAFVHGSKFNRQSGFMVGEKYSARRIEPLTPELLGEYKEQQRREARDSFLAQFLDNWWSLDPEKLEKVALALGWKPPDA